MRPEIEKAVALVRKHEPHSLDQALSLLQETVFSFSLKVCGQRQDAEDTTQEVLLKSIPYLSKFESPRALLVWLYKVAKNRCLMSRRKSRFAPREELSLEALMPDRTELQQLSGSPARSPEAALIGREAAKRLREAVQKLPPDYRLLIVLRDMEELSDQDVSEITGLRLGTIRVRLHRARLFVRKQLAAMDGRAGPRPKGPAKAKREPPARPPLGRCKELFAELSDYLDDRLDDSLCVELEKHMEGCQPCLAFLSSLEMSIRLCRSSPGEKPDPHRAARRRRELLFQYQELMSRVTSQARR